MMKIANNDIVLALRNVSKSYIIRENKNTSIRESIFTIFKRNPRRTIKALSNINLEIKKGEFFGIIGKNGSGKSTLLRVIIGALIPDAGGKVTTKGRIMRLSIGMGFDPNLSARENIYLNASLLGLSFKEIGGHFYEIIDFAELHDFVDTKLKFFSTGMRSRLGFSIALYANTDILLLDEFFGGVGDHIFKQKSEKVFEEAFIKGKTIIQVSHGLGMIKKHCDRVLLLDKGKQIIIDTPDNAIAKYKEL